MEIVIGFNTTVIIRTVRIVLNLAVSFSSNKLFGSLSRLSIYILTQSVSEKKMRYYALKYTPICEDLN